MAENRNASPWTVKDALATADPSHRAGEAFRPLAGRSGELALHELGESFVTSAVGIQRELRRYAENNGAFLLDEMEVDLPLKLRVDALGQVMAELVSDIPTNTAVARVRLRIRPDAQEVERLPILADQPLDVLKALSNEQIAFLESHRVFSVEDLFRASRNVAGRKALLSAIPEAVLDRALKAGGVLLVPVVPAKVAEALLRAGVTSVDDFLSRDATKLAPALSKVVGESVPAEDVSRWQKDLLDARHPIGQRLHPGPGKMPHEREAKEMP